MKYSVLWTQTAQDDVRSIYEYISAHESEERAFDVYLRLKTRASSLESFPMRGRELPELTCHNILGYRELVEHPWRIVYKVLDDKVFILSVFDGRRSFENVLMDRILRM